jgi:hypothetical protein
MSRASFADQIVNDFCGRVGLVDQRLDEEGRLTLQIGPLPTTFTFVSEPLELLWLHVELGEAPAGAAALRFLLEAGFESWGLNRMTIGLGDRDGKVWGYTCLPAAALSVDRFERTLNAMLEVALPIQERLLRRDFEPAMDQSDEAPSMPQLPPV